MTMSDLKEMLKEAIVTVKFTKMDGTERVMKCTQNMSYIPEESRPKTESTPKAQGLVTVWDTEKNGWRSFKENSVLSYE